MPAAAVTRGLQALSGITRRKGQVGGSISLMLKAAAHPLYGVRYCGSGMRLGKTEFLV